MSQEIPRRPVDSSDSHENDVIHSGNFEGPMREGPLPGTLPVELGVTAPNTVHEGFGELPPYPHERPIFDQKTAELRDSHATTSSPEQGSKTKRNVILATGATALASGLVAIGAWLGNSGNSDNKNNLPPAPEQTNAGPAFPGQVETSAPAAVETKAPSDSKEFQSPELEARYNSIVEAVRVPVEKYPDAELAYAKFSKNLENWVSLKPSKEDVAQFPDYKSDRQQEFNGSAGVVIDIDREAYVDTMFANGNGGAFAKEINGFNQILIGDYDTTYNEAVPYQLTYTLVDIPSISAPASNNQLSPVIATYRLLDNANLNSISKAREASGNKPVIDEKHGVYMEMIVVGEGSDAEWKIQKAQIVNRK
ncbi:MAG TPA: hypothetical protein VGO98_00375 [Candidatus Saccharimonadales bacterium]|jgi:hypothetical protein|nr:hypothetical protein [Candidatus Saccharimonadales bacterium]